MSLVRLQVYLARCGVASRRKAEALIQEGRVLVNGQVVTRLGTKVDPDRDVVAVDGEPVEPEPLVTVLLNKPKGYVSSVVSEGDVPPVTELVRELGVRLFPVGRLDVGTEGALLLSNDGELAHALTHPSRGVPKKYLARVRGRLSEEELARLVEGVELEDGPARPDSLGIRAETKGSTWVELELHEGRNRLVRRMFEALGHTVARLIRVSFAGLSVEDMPRGTWRVLSAAEIRRLRKLAGLPARPSVPRARSGGSKRVRRNDATQRGRRRVTDTGADGRREKAPRAGRRRSHGSSGGAASVRSPRPKKSPPRR